MKRGLFYFVIILIAVYSIAPLFWQFLTSIKPDADIMSLPPILPASPTLKHYIFIFDEGIFLKIILNSSIVALSTTVLSLAIGSLAGFALARLDVKGKGLILALVLSVSMFPPIATVSPLYLVFRSLELRDTIMALIITYTTFTLPLSIWIMTDFIRNIPGEIYSASLVDGCSPYRSFMKVLLPLSAPGLFSTGALVFIFSWNEFLYALTFTSSTASRTIPVEIAMFPGLHEVPWGEIAAASVVVTLPLLLLVFAFQKRIVEGLTAGAVKG